MSEPAPRTIKIQFRGGDGAPVELAADVTLPAGAAPKAVAVYMPGYTSVRRGEKAVEFRREFTQAGYAFVSFDPRGHGDSSGRIEDLTLDRHVEDLRNVMIFARSIAPACVGIGSSLGGLATAAYAAGAPDAFGFIIAIAPGFGFFERWSSVPEDKWPAAMTRAAVDSARGAATALIAPRVRTPMLVWHGMLDDAVEWSESARFAAACPAFVEVRLFNQGDHRLTAWKLRLARESCERAAEHVPPR